MKLARPLVGCLALIALAGCAAQPPGPATQASSTADPPPAELVSATQDEVVTPVSDRSKVTCRRERPTGSHIARRVCYSAAERAKSEEDAKEWMRRKTVVGPTVQDGPSGR